MGHFARDCPTQDPQPTKALGRLHHTLEAETPIGRSILNEFFNKLMRSERKQEIVKAKLKKARQQLNIQVNPQQVQAGDLLKWLPLPSNSNTRRVSYSHTTTDKCAAKSASGKTG